MQNNSPHPVETVTGFATSLELPRLLTLRQVAQSLGVCKRTIEREIANGRFPRPLKIGRSSRVPLSAVQAYVRKLAECTVGA